MKKLIGLGVLAAGPAMASAGNPFSGSFWTFQNTNLTVLISFLIFVGVLIYMKVPGRLMGMLDSRALLIREELDEARALREEAKAILASYERKRKDVQVQADRIVATARSEAMTAAEEAKVDLKASIARRLAGAEDRIASAEAAAIRAIREEAVTVAVAAAGDVLAQQMTEADAASSIDASIRLVGEKLH